MLKKPCLVIVAIGTTSINKRMKGHVKTPIQRIEKRLRERSKQVGEEKLKIVHCYEGNTTKFCSSCNQQNVVSRSVASGMHFARNAMSCGTGT